MAAEKKIVFALLATEDDNSHELSEREKDAEVEEEVNNFISYGSSSADAERKRKDISLLL